jgi:hypothetical protein
VRWQSWGTAAEPDQDEALLRRVTPLAELSSSPEQKQQRTTMTRDLGVWTAPDCALVLIDDQEEVFEVLPSIPSELDASSRSTGRR